tara:strand:- start:3763 stop:3963 length:201 start_codon:yes stop_codon:yes gene_type:complete
MNIKLKDKDKPISLKSGWCFMNTGFSSGLIEKINSGKEVKVDKIPKSAIELVKEVKKINKKVKKRR